MQPAGYPRKIVFYSKLLVALGMVGGLIGLLISLFIFIFFRSNFFWCAILIGFVGMGFFLLVEWVQFSRGKQWLFSSALLWPMSIAYFSIIAALLLACAGKIAAFSLSEGDYNPDELLTPSTTAWLAIIPLTLLMLPVFGLIFSIQLQRRTTKLRHRRRRAGRIKDED